MGFFYNVDNSQTEIFSVGTTIEKINNAKERIIELKRSLPLGDKIRILDYRNNDSDKMRLKCSILYETT